MDIHEDPEIDTTEKAVRFGCGALLGLFFGGYLVLRLALSSFGWGVTVIIGAVLVCGFLALKYGDEFWYAVFGSW